MTEFRKNMQILASLTVTDFKLKYNRNILGFFWSLIKPLLMLATLYIVFHLLMKVQTKHYELFLLLGIILWNYFVEATTYSMSAMTRSSNLIRKTKFEKKLLVVSSNISALITLALNMLIFAAFLAIAGIGFSWHIIIFMFLVLELFICSLGISFLLSALYVKFRDLQHIWEVLTQIGFWLTPIIYPISLIPPEYVKLYILNPFARIIEDSRNVLIFHTLPALDYSYAKHVYITIIICVAALALGIYVFDKLSSKFAEEV